MTFRVVGYDDTTDINEFTDTIWYDVTDYTYDWYTDWITILTLLSLYLQSIISDSLSMVNDDSQRIQ